jgi:hypothetical protein
LSAGDALLSRCRMQTQQRDVHTSRIVHSGSSGAAQLFRTYIGRCRGHHHHYCATQLI